MIEYIPVVMLREHLDDIPEYPFAEGYRMRLHRAGDRATWLRIQQASESLVNITAKAFDSSFPGGLAVLKRRGMFLVAPDGSDVGTITAWYERRLHGKAWGRIHWVAIEPPHRGKKLSKAMMTAALKHMRRLGHRRAMLTTQAPRTIAIRVYLDCGFVPDMDQPRAAEAWDLIGKTLRHPALGNM
ncbi:MAG: GNAT family N-acetyltransferase [Planctomycetes bacterium]|nr:GNAT family N-acetyltransferase [Planctomycetota bacterium]